jgi:glycosyltransferase involved in cell wall biosynthesis
MEKLYTSRSNNRAARIFYCGIVNTPLYQQYLGEELFVGAAAWKMSAIVQGLRLNAYRAFLLSLTPACPSVPKWRRRSKVLRSKVSCELFLTPYGNRVVRRILMPFVFLWFCSFWARKGDKFLFYNFFSDYLLGLLALKLRGIDTYLDVEDVPRPDVGALTVTLQRMVFKVTRRLCHDRVVAASTVIAKLLGAEVFVAVQGCVVPSGNPPPIRIDSDKIRFHYGGTIIPDTGSELFIRAVTLLQNLSVMERCEFVVTGFFDETFLRAASALGEMNKISIRLRKGISHEEYRCELDRSFASLALRLPDSSISDTTFPSKVIEIASRGRLVVTTSVSDVPLFFNSGNACLIEPASPEALARALINVANNPELYAAKAARGYQATIDRFGSKGVGRNVGEFLTGRDGWQ